jgi:hypothetical protein
MKSFKKFLLEKANTGGISDGGGIGTYIPSNDTATTSPLSSLNAAGAMINSNPNQTIGFELPNNMSIQDLQTIAYYNGIDVSPTDNAHQINSKLGSRQAGYQAMFAFAQQIPYQNVGVDGNTVSQMAQALSVNGFKLDEIYDSLLKIYMEMLKAQSGGKSVSPYVAINKMIADKYYKLNRSLSGAAGALNNIDTGEFKIPEFDPMADIYSSGLATDPSTQFGGGFIDQ